MGFRRLVNTVNYVGEILKLGMEPPPFIMLPIYCHLRDWA